MWYSAGNYQTLLDPSAPKKNRKRRAYIVGGDLPGLSAAAFLIRDAGLKPKRVTVYVDPIDEQTGPAYTGDPASGFVTRGRQELEEHFQTMWDLYSSIPSLVAKGSVLQEIADLNADDPNVASQRFTEKRGKPAKGGDTLGLSRKALKDIADLALALPEDLYDREIRKRVSKDFLASPFWLHLRTTFGFEKWHSALELKLHLQRYAHLLPHLADMSAWLTTRYNRYDSLILPLRTWLEDEGVVFVPARVDDVDFDIDFFAERKVARSFTFTPLNGSGKPSGEAVDVTLREKDLLLVTLGSVTDNARAGDHHTAPTQDIEVRKGGSWDLWRKIAVHDPAFGHPDNFCTRTGSTRWHSATLTVQSDRIRDLIEKVTGRDPASGKTVTGGVVTAVDSPWLLSWNVPRQPHFPTQEENQTIVWLYGKNPDANGTFVRKPMRECTGEEITKEWLYHLGAPEKEIDDLARKNVICRPVSQPFVTSPLLPRHADDRPKVVPEGAVNFGFLGQFVEASRDVILTPEYSVRTGMEAVYTLTDVPRAVPEVYNSTYDVRHLIRAAAALRDYEPYEVPKWLTKLVARTEIGWMLAHFGFIDPKVEVQTKVEAVTPVRRDSGGS